MARRQETIYPKKSNPVIVLICEGRNKTESKFFNHFKARENLFNLKIYPSEATDPKSMAKKARNLIDDLQLDSKLGDKVFCLIDLDLSQDKLNVIENERKKPNKKCSIDFILSNPCFEIWLLYYFTEHPHKEQSSHKVKEQLKKYVPQYNERYDILKEYSLQDKLSIALERAIKKNTQFEIGENISTKNPYTEVPKLINFLLKKEK